MEKDFQTSFIPKKPMMEERAIASRPVGFLPALSAFFLLVVFILSGALYFYNGVLKKKITDMENGLTLAQNRFEPSKIVQLKVLDKRLRAATEILSTHIAISPIFKSLQALTMKTVRFTTFNYSFGNTLDKKTIDVTMNGFALGYSAVALQADLFAKNKFFIDPVFSNLSLDNTGNVTFDLEFSVDPSFVDYKQMLLTENEKIE